MKIISSRSNDTKTHAGGCGGLSANTPTYTQSRAMRQTPRGACCVKRGGPGLIASDAQPEDSSEALSLLREATVSRPIVFSIVDDPQVDLSALDEGRRSLLRQLQELREEIADVERLRREVSEFEIEAHEQEARLASIGLFTDAGDDAGEACPLCESQLVVSVPTVAEIRASLADVQTQLRSVRRDAPRLQERLARLESQRADLNEQPSRRADRDRKADSGQ